MWKPTLALALALFGAACTPLIPVSSVTHEVTLQQAVLMPAPTGSPVVGPLVEAGHLAVEGGISADFAGTELEQGESGNIVIDKVAHIRVTGSPTPWLELGFGADYVHASWGTVDTTPISLSEEQGHAVLRVGPHVRALLLGDDRLGMGGLFDVTNGVVPYRQTTRYDVSHGAADERVERATPLGAELAVRFTF